MNKPTTKLASASDRPNDRPNDQASAQTVAERTKEVQFGDLVLAYTTRYQHCWDDHRTGSKVKDGAFYHPVPPPGFSTLGTIGLSSHDNPDGKFASLCVKAAPSASGRKAPLAAPTRWEFIWSDAGSGASQQGSCWRPIPPAGYVALGDVFVAGRSAPMSTPIMCVAKELVFEGKIGELLWSDRHSGADRDFSAWQIDASRAYIDTPDGIFAVNSFVAVASHGRPASSPVAWNLRLPLPTYEAGGPAKPVLTSRTRPPAATNPVVDRIVTVPFTAVIDNDKSLQWKVDNSPFYTIERSVDYRLMMFLDNDSNTQQSTATELTTGVSTEQSETFSITTGITISYENGVDTGGFSSKASVSLSIELGYSTTTSVVQFRSETDQATLVASPKTAAAMWTESDSIRLYRADATPVGAALSFDTTDTAYVVSDFAFGPTDQAEGASTRPGALVSRSRRRLLG